MKIRLLVVAAAATLLLSACANKTVMEGSGRPGPTLPESTASTTTTPTTTTPAGPSRNARGNIEKALGEEGGIADVATDEPIITFTVDAIGPAECSADYESYGSPPENGHLIAVHMRFSTSAALGTTEGGDYFTVSAYDFTFISPDNITHSDLGTIASYSCSPADEFPSDPLQPAQQYVGQIVLDLSAPNGTLIYRPSGMTDGGWEWKF